MESEQIEPMESDIESGQMGDMPVGTDMPMEPSMDPSMDTSMDELPEELPEEEEQFSLDFYLSAANIADGLSEEELSKIGRLVIQEFNDDLGSRSDWEKRYSEALKLAAQVVETKSTPWQGAANVKFPLLTTACVQFSARAYPALIPGTDIVKCHVTGYDTTGQKEARAVRVGKHMSYQILEEMEEWEEDMDRLLIMLPITGTEFKKTYFSPSLGRNVSEHVLAKDLVVNYWAKSLETATRKSHIIRFTDNEIREKVIRGVFLDHDFTKSDISADELRTVSDTIQGLNQPGNDDDAPHEFIEQHRWLDLDEDDYKEPYIVTVHRQSEKVVRISAGWDSDGVEKTNDGKIISIEQVQYFTKYSFIPSIDGGFYDFGWGLLLGPINETINTTINQLLDAGTLSNMQSGFLAKGIRVRGGSNSFQVGEWKTVDSTGDDLRKGIMPLPVREPSQTLFQLLGMMIESGEKLTNLTDILMGQNPGQNQPATTTMAVIEQGLKVFTAVYKRLYRSLKKEYRKLYRLNKIFLDEKEYFRILDPGQEATGEILRSDYIGDPTDVQPSADPNVVSEAQRLAKAEALIASMNNGAPVNPLEVWRRYYEAMNLPGIDRLLPEQMPEPQPDPKILQLQQEDKHKHVDSAIEAERIRMEQERLLMDQERLELDKQKQLFTEQIEQMKLQPKELEDNTLEQVKLQHNLTINQDDQLLKREIAELQEATKLKIATLVAESNERTAQFEAQVKVLMKNMESSGGEKEQESEEKPDITAALMEAITNMNKPKMIITDKDGIPIGIKAE